MYVYERKKYLHSVKYTAREFHMHGASASRIARRNREPEIEPTTLANIVRNTNLISYTIKIKYITSKVLSCCQYTFDLRTN